MLPIDQQLSSFRPKIIVAKINCDLLLQLCATKRGYDDDGLVKLEDESVKDNSKGAFRDLS